MVVIAGSRGGGGGGGLLSELESTNVGKERKQLVMLKLWRTIPENRGKTFSDLVPDELLPEEVAELSHHDTQEDTPKEDVDSGMESGTSTPVNCSPIIAGMVGQQTGQTPQQTGQGPAQGTAAPETTSPECSPTHGTQSDNNDLENTLDSELATIKENVAESIRKEEEEDDPVKKYEGSCCPGDPRIKMAVYEFMEDPSTPAGHAVSAFIMFIILFSVTQMIVESLPQYNYNADGSKNTQAEGRFFVLESICIAIFTVDYGIRFYCTHDKKSFVVEGMNVIDFLAIVPYYISLVLSPFVDVSQISQLRLLRLARVLRVLKLARYNRSIAVALDALTQSTHIFALMLFMLTILCIVFASFQYNFEYEAKSRNPPATAFESIPMAMWWCIVTVMMVGYGDMYPVTVAGKLCASVCIVVGILIMALPISVIGSNFSRVWEEFEEKLRMEAKEREAAIVLTPEQRLEKQRKHIEAVVELNTITTKRLTAFLKCCEQQVKVIKDTEQKIFEQSQDLWNLYHVDANALGPNEDLRRDRKMRANVSATRTSLKTLSDDNGMLSKVCDDDLEQQLSRALVNLKWAQLYMEKHDFVMSDAQRLERT